MRGDLSMVLVWTALTLLAPAICVAEDRGRVYAGGLAGVSTLSADARSVISADGFATSLYKPENGLAANLLIGAHLHDYVTIQASYIWNRNALTLVSARAIGDTSAFYEQHRNSSQHAVVGDLLVYFRARGKRVRPYYLWEEGSSDSLAQATGMQSREAPFPLNKSSRSYGQRCGWRSAWTCEPAPNGAFVTASARA